MSSRKKVIIDCDPGVDDAHAIMIAVARSDVEVVAITVVNGNCAVDQGCVNALKILRACNRLDVPVYRGSCTPLLGPQKHKLKDIHGVDGLGDVPDSNPPCLELIQREHAVHALIRLINQHKGEITLVPIGPLTNVALAIRLHPNLGASLKEAVIMGGNIEGKGNVTVSGEFNFAMDPEAAHVVLNELGCPIKLLSWETTGFHHKLDWDWYNHWIEIDTDLGRFNKAVGAKKTEIVRNLFNMGHYNSCDPWAIAVAIDNKIILESKKHYCTVELSGNITRGQMIVDWSSHLEKSSNVEIVTKLDVDLLKRMLEIAVR